MRTSRKKVAAKHPTSVNLSEEDRRDLQRLSEAKYRGALGFTTVLREEGMPAVRAEIERITKEKETTPTS